MDFFTKNKQTIEKYFIFSVLVYSVVSICGDIWGVFANKIEVREVLNFYVRWLQNILFMTVLFLFIFKLKIAFFISLILGYFEVDYSVFANYITPIFINNNSGISPEYGRIVFFTLMLLAMLIKILTKKEKFKDLFLLLSMTGVIVTAILFHIIVTSQLNYFTNEQEQRWQSVYNKNDLETICKVEKLECEKIELNKKIINDNVNNYYENYSVREYMKDSNNYFRYQIISDLSISNRIHSRKPLAFVKNKDGAFYIFDKNNYTEYLKFNETMFGILAFSSHMVWIFGALYLIYFHTRKYKIKL